MDVGSGSLTGAGSTFDNPLFTKAFFDYSAKYPQVSINYQPVGSGAGIQQFIKKTVDFGATDVPMGSADIASAGGPGSLVQIPVTLGAVSIAYNLAGVSKLQIDGPTLANIYLGHIKKWNDPAIAALNSGVNLPNEAITVAHRSDGSGTTYIFTDYLAKVSPEWKSSVGTAKSVQWPVGVGGSGNQAVAQVVTSTAGAIGYVELAYVVQAQMTMAYVKNANGQFLQASVPGATAAAAQVSDISATNFSITNQPGDTTYPIAGFSWAILYTSYSDANKGKAVVNLFKWLVTTGQADGVALQYSPLPTPVQQLALANLKLIKAGGTAVLS
ncbi:MAG TPA: phosphate ABC transporter substrate-binding protein PstS [Candidatus Dormibacteraeota bacterium]|nr:phosphate ABC transporter substrate-binding protein PstS [Candidatus Dormibacteraeota bacterium]